jgi:hypothetical protein
MTAAMVFDDTEVKAMTVAYETILAELKVVDRDDPITDIIARKIIALCATRACEAHRLAEVTLQQMRF